jgi:hypothetical protein
MLSHLVNVRLDESRDDKRKLPSPVALGLLLGLLRTQLPGMRGFALVSEQRWVDTGGAQWYQLGSMSQLTSLELNFLSTPLISYNYAFAVRDLAQLGRLTGLQRLAVKAAKVKNHKVDSDLQFLSKLTALTALTLALPPGQSRKLEGFGRCTNLRSLVLPVLSRRLDVCGDKWSAPMGPTPCDAMSGLTGLTKLLVGWELQPDDTWRRLGATNSFQPHSQERMYRWTIEQQLAGRT